jgi:hypothetical protein
MVGHLANADPACAEGVKKRHHARHDGAAMPGDERRAAGTNLGLLVTGKLLTLDRTLDPPSRRQRTIDDAKRVLLREARAQPLLLVVEDLHWIDDETQALLDGLVDGLGSARPLPAESTTELLESLLGEDASLVPLKQLLVKRGNPFFLEETVYFEKSLTISRSVTE